MKLRTLGYISLPTLENHCQNWWNWWLWSCNMLGICRWKCLPVAHAGTKQIFLVISYRLTVNWSTLNLKSFTSETPATDSAKHTTKRGIKFSHRMRLSLHLHWANSPRIHCSSHHSLQNTESLIGLCFSNMFLMKMQHITLSLLAARAQFTKVGVRDKKRVHLQSRLCNESHAARVE